MAVSNSRFDYVVVGGGTAGVIVAARLAAAQRRVLLLEAGPDYPDGNTPEEIRIGRGPSHQLQVVLAGRHAKVYSARLTNDLQLGSIPRGSVVGGSSAVNAMIFLRGEPEDYDSWGPGWTFSDLLPHFKGIESDPFSSFAPDYHGATGPMVVNRFPEIEWSDEQIAFRAACLSLGYADCVDHNAPNSTGVGPTPFNCRDGIRLSTAYAYLTPELRQSGYLTVRGNCTAHRILFDRSRATGVQYAHAGTVLTAAADEEVIISAGAIGSPHLLLLSGIGSAEQLSEFDIPMVSDLPGVGTNLRDHPQCSLLWSAGREFAPGNHARLQLTLRTTSSASVTNDLLLHPLKVAHQGASGLSWTVGVTACLFLADGSGTLSLQSSNPYIQPSIDLNYLSEQRDLARMVEAVKRAWEIAHVEPFRRHLGCGVGIPSQGSSSSWDDDVLVKWLSRNVTTSHHPTSTCKMGDVSDRRSVVDYQGRVHGVERLRVADASIMPDNVRANTNLSCMVVGHRIADFLCGERQAEPGAAADPAS